MRDLLRDMLIWLATFFALSLALICTLRWSLSRVRKRRAEQLKAIEARCRETPEDLGLPLSWRTSPKTSSAADYQWAQTLEWSLPLGLLAAGITWSATGRNGWSWGGVLAGFAVSLLSYLVIAVWMHWRCQTITPPAARRLALALRCWAIRISSGIEIALALEKTARQLRRIDPELGHHLEAAAVTALDRDLLQRAFYPCGTGVAERLADIVTGNAPNAPAALRELADRLDGYYLNQSVARTRMIDSWMKYPIGLCLVPAVNLMLFGPAITDLLEKFGTVRLPGAKPAQVQPLEEVAPAPAPADVPSKDAI